MTAAADRFLEWVKADALPAWGKHGFDATEGRFHERLDGARQPMAVPHRAMVQARQIYVFAHAGALGWAPDGIDLAVRAMATMQRDFCLRAGGRTRVHFSINLDPPAPHSIVRDAYAHAFVLFATAFLHRATGDASLLAFAEEVHRFIEAELSDARHGGIFTSDENGGAGEKLQNPHMHLLEAYLALAEEAPDGEWLARARAIVALFEQRMLRHDHGILPERFADDWGAHPEPAVATVFEPGHHFEWAWLLRWYERLAGGDFGPTVTMLLETALQPAAATPDGLILDQLDASGTVVRNAHRLWPHCEAIKAATVFPDGLGDPRARQLAEASAGVLLDHFLGRPFTGGWVDQIGADRRPLVDYVPASSLYHLVLAAVVLDGAHTASGRSPTLVI